MKLIPKTISNLSAFVICVLSVSLSIAAQSTDQNFPTAVTTNEISGTIKARDVGDSRLTSYYYIFDGGQGDVFINTVTKNFNGDIDVFAADGLRPLTKMVVYADAGESETGRLVYLRKPERLILRVEGRSPNDDPSTFRIKFAGSFIALAEQKTQDIPTVARREIDADSGVRVNSVGTIVEVIPKSTQSAKATPDKTETVAAADKPKESERAKKETVKTGAPETSKVKKPASAAAAKTPHVKKSKTAKKASAPAKKPTKRNESPEVNTVFKKSSKPKKEPAARTVKSPPPPETETPDPMASFKLVVQLKDGKTIERPMNEVTKFTVDKGVLTVTATDGGTVIYSMGDVAKVTIE